MKLTQELIVTIVFLIGSWVVLSVAAVAFPPSASSIRDALNKHASARPSEPVISQEALAEPAETFYQEEKLPVVQVVSGDPEQNEIFILSENESIPEKMLEEHPEAKLAVLGGDEETINKHIEKFNIAAKNVAIKVALAKEALIRQADAENHKLQEWKEWSERKGFALDVTAKKFELPLQKLHDALKQLAVQPEAVLPNIGLESPADDVKAHAKLNTRKNNKVEEAQLSGWNQLQVEAAMKFIADDKARYSVCKRATDEKKTQSRRTVNVAFEKAAKVSVPVATVAAAPVAKSVINEEPRLEALNEKFALTIKSKSYHLTGLQELSAPLAALAVEQVHAVEAKPMQLAEQGVKTAPVTNSQAVSKKFALKAKVQAQEKVVQPVKEDKLLKARALAPTKQAEVKPAKQAAVVVLAPVVRLATATPAVTPAPAATQATAATVPAPTATPAPAPAPAASANTSAEPINSSSESKVEPAAAVANPPADKMEMKAEPQAAASQAIEKSVAVTQAAAPVQNQSEDRVVTIVKGPVTAEANQAPAVKAKTNGVFKPVIKRFVPDHAVASANQNQFAKRLGASAKPKVKPVNYTAEQLAAIEQSKSAKRDKLVKRERALRNLEKQLETEPMNISQPQVAERKVDAPASVQAAIHPAVPHGRYDERQRPTSTARRQQMREERAMHQDNSNDFNDDFQSGDMASHRDRAWEYETYGYAREFSDAEAYSNLMQD
jgi:hypothetical protein